MNTVDLEKQTAYLANHDPILATIITRVPVPKITEATDHFKSLVESIVSQQLSTKAADTILARFVGLFSPHSFPTPQQILSMSDEHIRSAGLSFQKISYIKDLSQRVDEKLLDLQKVAMLDNEEVILQLTQVKGIGRWTAEMFLMFSLAKPDVFSYGDLGLRNAIKKLYKLKTHPSEKKAQKISSKWKPYRTLACRYLWKSLELSI